MGNAESPDSPHRKYQLPAPTAYPSDDNRINHSPLPGAIDGDVDLPVAIHIDGLWSIARHSPLKIPAASTGPKRDSDRVRPLTARP
jgi:hypothetical protein